MKWQCLPPAGGPVVWHEKQLPQLTIPGYELIWVSSGTAALAFALKNHKQLHPEIVRPEVLVPGYCCPDLLAAARYAGFVPVVVDISVDDPGYDLAELERALTPNTLAVIAINFLGVKDRLAAIRERLDPYPNIALIEDNAQWFPNEPEATDFAGDYLTFSFGRGKAIGLLAGGLVAVRKPMRVYHDLVEAGASSGKAWPVKAWLVNQLARPHAFYWLNLMPFIHLGETRYHGLEAISGFPERAQLAFESNFRRFRHSNITAEDFYDQLFQRLGWNRFGALSGHRRGRLLRYPVLCNSPEHRDQLLVRLVDAGLGASAMYKTELPRVNGVAELPEVVIDGELINARHFAERLLTLPVHEAVNYRVLCEIGRVVTASTTGCDNIRSTVSDSFSQLG